MTSSVLKQEIARLDAAFVRLGATSAQREFQDLRDATQHLAVAIQNYDQLLRPFRQIVVDAIAGAQPGLVAGLVQANPRSARTRLENTLHSLSQSLSGLNANVQANGLILNALKSAKEMEAEIARKSEALVEDLDSLQDKLDSSIDEIGEIDQDFREFGEEVVGDIESEASETIDEIQGHAEDAFGSAIEEIEDSLDRFGEIDDIILEEIADIAVDAVNDIGEQVIGAQTASQVVAPYAPQIAAFRQAAEIARDIVQAAKGG